MSIVKVTVEAKIEQPVEKIWEFYNEPQHITQWNFASPDWHCPSAQSDLRVGGKYISRMEARDGSMGFDFEAIFDEVDLHKKITYTMVDGRKADIFFQPSGNTSNITIVFDAESENSPELQKSGWQAILNNFKTYCEGK
ncbi:MAG TPA: SRPBCC family protein [Flavobacteriales bacterium]|nr:activator of HSP90 ATPase [Flavobacteriales bacterium]HRE75696.1 SRPBCC family protein [Flavobacteriales bacterium]HRE97651.1 SRPBCC family protein [Flavobacteriales bacterium]HRJ34376.1 SRPBCC family protein [Flavobacteriales bacterium]HRJ39705.1 SRPBCC family protein [Flavobacteriales bacterium]